MKAWKREIEVDVLSLFVFAGGNTITARGLLLWVFLSSCSVKIELRDNKCTHRLNLISFERGEQRAHHSSYSLRESLEEF